MGSSHDSGYWTCKGCFNCMAWDAVDAHQAKCSKYKNLMKGREKEPPSIEPATYPGRLKLPIGHQVELSDNETDPGLLWAEIHRLREELKGPEGFASWKEAAEKEKLYRVAQQEVAQRLDKQNAFLKARLNSWLTRGRDLTLADPEMAEQMAALKKRLADDPEFALETLRKAGLV